MSYRSDIDGLRAIAILSVLLFHFQPELLPGGFTGVDIFFVLSGYLITQQVFMSCKEQRFSLLDFYARRIRRIFPALLLVLGSSLLAGYFIFFPSEIKALAAQVESSTYFYLNFKFWGDSKNYFDTAQELKPLLHLWSLAIEEQFYLVWPVLFWLFFKIRKVRWGVSFVLLTSLAYCLYLSADHPMAAFYHPYSRAWELMLGALLVFVPENKHYKNLRSAIGILLLACGFLWISPKNFPGGQALFPTLGTALLIHAGADTFFNNKVLSSGPMVYLGRISYPLYLWHWPLLAFARTIEGGITTGIILISILALSVLLAVLTYELIEKPLRCNNHALTWRPIISLLALMGAIGLSAHHLTGLKRESRNLCGYNVESVPLSDDPAQAPPINCLSRAEDACTKLTGDQPPLFNFCRAAGDPEKPTILILGDSHASALFSGFAPVAYQNGWSTLVFANSACPPLLGITTGQNEKDREECQNKNSQIYKLIAQLLQIKKILLVTRGPIYLTNQGFGPAEKTNDSFELFGNNNLNCPHRDAQCLFTKSLTQTIEHLSARHRLAILLQPPELGFSPENCLKRPFRLTQNPICHVERQIVESRQLEYREILFSLHKLQPSKFKLIDPLPIFCTSEICNAKIQNQILYSDDDHLSYQGGRLLSESVLLDFIKN